MESTIHCTVTSSPYCPFLIFEGTFYISADMIALSVVFASYIMLSLSLESTK